MTCIRDGWQIPADIFNHSIRMLISEEEIRSCKTTPHPPKRGSGYLKRYRAMVVSANRGAIPNEDNL